MDCRRGGFQAHGGVRNCDATVLLHHQRANVIEMVDGSQPNEKIMYLKTVLPPKTWPRRGRKRRCYVLERLTHSGEYCAQSVVGGDSFLRRDIEHRSACDPRRSTNAAILYQTHGYKLCPAQDQCCNWA